MNIASSRHEQESPFQSRRSLLFLLKRTDNRANDHEVALGDVPLPATVTVEFEGVFRPKQLEG